MHIAKVFIALVLVAIANTAMAQHTATSQFTVGCQVVAPPQEKSWSGVVVATTTATASGSVSAPLANKNSPHIPFQVKKVVGGVAEKESFSVTLPATKIRIRSATDPPSTIRLTFDTGGMSEGTSPLVEEIKKEVEIE